MAKNDWQMNRLNPENFQEFGFWPKFAVFLRKITIIIARMNSQISTNSPDFNGSGHNDIGYFR